MNLRQRKIGQWIFVILTVFILIGICLIQVKAQKEGQVEVPADEWHKHVRFYYDEKYNLQYFH